MVEAMSLSVCCSIGYRMYELSSSKGRHYDNKDSTSSAAVFCCQQAVLSQLVSTDKNVKQYTFCVEGY